MCVVFDLGGVVVRWAPDEFLADVYPDPAVRERVRTELVRHDDWRELDRGTLTADAALRRASARSGLSKETIARFLDHVPDALEPVPETVALLRDLKCAGHQLFCLSNMHHAFVERFEQEHDFLDLFDGVVVSCRVGLVKPEPAIYEHLLATHDLQGKDAVFVDDDRRNVQVGETLGMRGIHFVDAAQCRLELLRLGCSATSSSSSPPSP